LDEEEPARLELRSSREDAQKLKPEPHDPAKTFARIERAVGFEAYRRRQLDPGASPTQAPLKRTSRARRSV
jgi:hypothetical protein